MAQHDEANEANAPEADRVAHDPATEDADIPLVERPDVKIALQHLNQRLADPAKAAADQAMIKPRIDRPAALKAAGLGAGLGVALAFQMANDSNTLATIVPVALGSALIGGFAFYRYFRLPPRSKVLTPEETLHYYFKSIELGQFSYAWSMLCPTAREERVDGPDFVNPEAEPQSIQLNSLSEFEQYAQLFKDKQVSGEAPIETTRATSVLVDGNVAIADIGVTYRFARRWNSAASAAKVLIAPNMSAEFALRKTLIRGNDDLWYVLHADLCHSDA